MQLIKLAVLAGAALASAKPTGVPGPVCLFEISNFHAQEGPAQDTIVGFHLVDTCGSISGNCEFSSPTLTFDNVHGDCTDIQYKFSLVHDYTGAHNFTVARAKPGIADLIGERTIPANQFKTWLYYRGEPLPKYDGATSFAIPV